MDNKTIMKTSSRMRPIALDTESVRAILQGKKTQIRQVLNVKSAANPYSVGDTLWVREAYCEKFDGIGDSFDYRADWHNQHTKTVGKLNPYGFEVPRWRSQIVMPKSMARIFLRITGRRTENLQEISMNDMEAEGVVPDGVKNGTQQQWQQEYFKPYWDSIHREKRDGWYANPIVIVYEFSVVKADPK